MPKQNKAKHDLQQPCTAPLMLNCPSHTLPTSQKSSWWQHRGACLGIVDAVAALIGHSSPEAALCVSNQTSLEIRKAPKRCIRNHILQISNTKLLDAGGDNVVPTTVLFPGQACLAQADGEDLPAAQILDLFLFSLHFGRYGSTIIVSSSRLGSLLPVSQQCSAALRPSETPAPSISQVSPALSDRSLVVPSFSVEV